MSNNDNNNRPNLLENQLEDIREWQDNANNPGYYVGSGKVPLPTRNILKSPIIMLIIGIVIAIPVLYSLSTDFNIEDIFTNIVVIVISVGLIIGGIIRIVKKV